MSEKPNNVLKVTPLDKWAAKTQEHSLPTTDTVQGPELPAESETIWESLSPPSPEPHPVSSLVSSQGSGAEKP